MKKSRSGPTKRDYTIGKGRPPLHTRFKPGQSGNPSGRPKGSRDFESIVAETLRQKFPVKEGGKVRRLSTPLIMIRQLATQAMKGDQKAIMFFMNYTQASTFSNSPAKHPDMKKIDIR